MPISINEYDNVNACSDDWGWFIDIENCNPIYHENKKIKNKNKNKNNVNIIDKNIENEYNYYINNQIDLDVNLDKLYENSKVKCYSDIEYMIEICTKTIFGVLLTYIVFIII
jgi:hypothetical protein